MANPHDGEVTLTLSGREVTLRPTFEVMVKIEQATGRGMVALARQFATMNFGYSEAAAIIASAAIGDPRPTHEQVGTALMRTGLAAVAAPLTEFLEYAVTGGRPAGAAEEGETKPAAGT